MNDDHIPDPRDLTLLAGGDVDEFSVQLGVYGDDLNPVWLSELLGVEPTQSHRKGDDKRGAYGRAVWKTGAWIHKVRACAPTTPEEVLLDILNSLPARKTLWEDLSKRYLVEVRFGLFLKFWNRDFEISHSVAIRITDIGANLLFCVYFDQSDSGEE